MRCSTDLPTERHRGWTLDIGCGTYCRGDVGVDIQFTYMHPDHVPEKFDTYTAPAKSLRDLVKADCNYHLPFRDECFVEVYIVHTLEHLLRPYELLCEVRRVLKRGGVLKVIVPNAKVNWADERDPEHVFSFTIHTITRLVSKVLRIRRSFTIFNDWDIYVEAEKT